MVGVAGRSSGCATCRRRKVRCDLQKPGCGRCFKLGRVCEGYDRYPVFVNRNTDGLMKRKKLEEAKPYAPSNATFPHSPPATPSVEMQAVSWFWETYAPQSSAGTVRQGPAVWLNYAIEAAPGYGILHRCLVGLAFSSCGRVAENLEMARRGDLVYVSVLGELKRTIMDEEEAKLDEVLASVRVLVLYEFLLSSSEDRVAWSNHLEGMEALLLARGFERHTAGMSNAIFREIRYPLMMKAIMSRKASPFGRPVWTLSAQHHDTSFEDAVIGLGFHLASLLERSDILSSERRRMETMMLAVKLLKDTSQHFQEMQKAAEGYSATMTGHPNALGDSGIDKMTLSTLQLVSTFIMAGLLQKIDMPQTKSFLEMEALILLEQVRGQLAQQEELVEEMKRTIRWCMTADVGQYVVSRAIFPTTTLLWYYRHSHIDVQNLLAIKQTMTQRQRIGFARNVTRDRSIVPNLIRDGLSQNDERRPSDVNEPHD